MFCNQCGTQVNDGQAFCPNCGAPIGAQQEQNTAPMNSMPASAPYQQPMAPMGGSSNTNNTIALILGIVSIILGVLGGVLFGVFGAAFGLVAGVVALVLSIGEKRDEQCAGHPRFYLCSYRSYLLCYFCGRLRYLRLLSESGWFR